MWLFGAKLSTAVGITLLLAFVAGSAFFLLMSTPRERQSVFGGVTNFFGGIKDSLETRAIQRTQEPRSTPQPSRQPAPTQQFGYGGYGESTFGSHNHYSSPFGNSWQ